MEDVIEWLREKNETVPVPLDLPDEDDLVEIEEALFLPLPREYKDFLLTVSDVIFGRLEPATVCDETSHTFLPELAAVAWDLGVSRELIPFCEDQGNYYCLQQDGEVVLITPDGPDEETWASIWHWARDVWLES